MGTRPPGANEGGAPPGPTLDWLDVERSRSTVMHSIFGTPRQRVEIGRFEILRRLGEGAMGRVYLARDPVLERDVAVKIIRTAREGSGSGTSQARLIDEARAIARLDHSNVVTVHEAGHVEDGEGDEVYVAMEYVAGTTLREWQSRPGRGWRDILDKYLAAGRGLAAAHGAGIVHRDFKPDNVLVADDGGVRVVDFGLARGLLRTSPDETPGPASDSASDSADGGVERTAWTRPAGTPAYMAPEQQYGGPIAAAADQFSYCVALSEALLGRLPLAANRGAASGAGADPRAFADLSLLRPRWLRRALERGVSIDPAQRWPSMAALLEELGGHEGQGRRWGWWLGAAGLVGALAIVATPTTPACEPPVAELAGVWDETVRAEIGEAFEASGRAYAGDAWKRTEQILDRHAAAWLVDATESCRLERSGPASIAKAHRSCVDGNLRRLKGLTSILTAADPDVVERAVAASERLPPAGTCERLDALSAAPSPDDDELAAHVERVRRALEQVEIELDTGRVGEARERSEQALLEAEALDYAPLLAEAQLSLGRVMAMHRDDTDARDMLEAAYWTARASGHDEAQLDASLWLIFVSGKWLSQLEQARAWAKSARADLTRLDANAERRARLASHLGAALLEGGRFEEARASLEEAIELLDDGGRDPGLELARVRNLLGIVRLRIGELPLARREFERALAIYEERVGSEHPDLGSPLQNLALVAQLEGDLDGARKLLLRTLELRTRAFGPDDSRVGEIENNLGALELGVGRHAAARPHLRRALRIYEGTRGLDHPSVGVTLYNLAFVAHRTGELGAAIAGYEDAHELLEKSYGADSPLLAGLLAYRASALLEAGHRERARPLVARALELCEQVDADATDCAQVTFVDGMLHWADGEREQGLVRVRAARETYVEIGYASELEVIEAWLAAHR